MSELAATMCAHQEHHISNWYKESYHFVSHISIYFWGYVQTDSLNQFFCISRLCLEVWTAKKHMKCVSYPKHTWRWFEMCFKSLFIQIHLSSDTLATHVGLQNVFHAIRRTITSNPERREWIRAAEQYLLRLKEWYRNTTERDGPWTCDKINCRVRDLTVWRAKWLIMLPCWKAAYVVTKATHADMLVMFGHKNPIKCGQSNLVFKSRSVSLQTNSRHKSEEKVEGLFHTWKPPHSSVWSLCCSKLNVLFFTHFNRVIFEVITLPRVSSWLSADPQLVQINLMFCE